MQKAPWTRRVFAAMVVLAVNCLAAMPGFAQSGAVVARSSDTIFRIPLPDHRFFSGGGTIIHMTAIGPVERSRIIGTTFDITWSSDGTTPAAELEIEVGVQVDNTVRSVIVTGAALGFGSGPGVFRGTLFTDRLNGTVWQPDPFQHSIVEVFIGAVNGGVEGRGFFINSEVRLEMVPATAAVATETFEDLANDAGWTWGTGAEAIEGAGGNGGAFLHDPFVFSFGPGASSGPGVSSDFTGDYRERRVVSLGIDLKTFSVSGNVSARRLSLILWNDNGTPLDLEDDWGAYVLGRQTVPQVIGLNEVGWISYDFLVPSESRSLPAGWELFGQSRGRTWNDLITAVSRVEFFYGDPGLFQLFHTWNVGMDNPRIGTRPR